MNKQTYNNLKLLKINGGFTWEVKLPQELKGINK